MLFLLTNCIRTKDDTCNRLTRSNQLLDGQSPKFMFFVSFLSGYFFTATNVSILFPLHCELDPSLCRGWQADPWKLDPLAEAMAEVDRSLTEDGCLISRKTHLGFRTKSFIVIKLNKFVLKLSLTEFDCWVIAKAFSNC